MTTSAMVEADAKDSLCQVSSAKGSLNQHTNTWGSILHTPEAQQVLLSKDVSETVVKALANLLKEWRLPDHVYSEMSCAE